MEAKGQVDRALISRCIHGDEIAWQELVSRYQSLVYSVVRLYFRDTGVAEDVFQDVWLELYRRLESIEDVQALPAWLITVSRRKCSSTLSRTDWDAVDADSIALIDQRVPAIESRFWIERSLATLSERDRHLIEALYLDPSQPSYDEISARLGIPVASIGATRARCLKKLREAWEGRE